MEKVYEELDDVKAEIEKLRADNKSKAELCDNLKKARSEQLIRLQEANSKVEKQAQELIEKETEISEVQQLNEDLKGSLIEKESVIKRLGAANEKLRANSDEKNQRLEEEVRGLALALDEANEKNIDQEQKINVLKAEVEGLKGLLSASQKKCLAAERKAGAAKELRARDEILLKLEDEKRKVEDKLKWKKEQFKHLEEAHDKLQDQFRACKKEWEKEKSKLVEEICSLQTSLDAQTRISGELQKRLQMCNEALAHEETRRKYLEVQVSEFTTRFENTLDEYEDAKSQLESLIDQRDKEIAALRHLLGTEKTNYKEKEYQAGKLESENQELLESLRELQEAQIHNGGSSTSLAKLRNKLRNVEQLHRDCSANLKAKEVEWSSLQENMERELNGYMSEIERRDAASEELERELESCYSSILQLTFQNEEMSVMLLVLKEAMTEAKKKHAHAEDNLYLSNKKGEEQASALLMQLEMKTAALAKAEKDIQVEREKTASLLVRIESLNLIEEQGLLMQKEINRYKEMLDESARCQVQLKEKAIQLENEFEEALKGVFEALDAANVDLAKEREKTASLSRTAESLDHIEKQRSLLQKELEKSKEMLEESTRCQIQLKEHVAQVECDSEKKLREVCQALEAAKHELTDQRERAACLSSRVDFLDQLEKQNLLMQKELERYKNLLDESSRSQLRLQEQVMYLESDSKEKFNDVCGTLDSLNSELMEERKKVASLSSNVESLEHIETQCLSLQKELERYKEALEESLRTKLQLEERALLIETDSKNKLKQVNDALDAANTELAEKTSEAHQIEFELWIWKAIAERLRGELEESQDLCKELEASLLAQVEFGETIKEKLGSLVRILEEKDHRIRDFMEQIALLEQEHKAKQLEAVSYASREAESSFETQKESLLQILKEKEMILENLQSEIGWLEQESLRRELESIVLTQIGAEQLSEHEKENLHQLVEEKNSKIDDPLQLVRSLELNFNSSLNKFSSQLAKKQEEMNLVCEAWEKISAAETLAMVEIEEKKLMIVEMEDEISKLQEKLDLQRLSVSLSEQQASEIKAELESKQMEVMQLTRQLETAQTNSDSLVLELKSQNRSLHEDEIKLLSERENIVSFMGALDEKIGKLCSEDMQLIEHLGRLVQSFNSSRSEKVIEDDADDSIKENINCNAPHHSPTSKKLDEVVSPEERSPFRLLN